MVDGFGLEYLEQSSNARTWRVASRRDLQPRERHKPSVTNTNNASICCGVWPEQHGITGNSYFDERTGHESYMETADLL